MPVLTITKTYADGSILAKADLDTSFDAIATFLNSTGIDSTNIQAGGVTGTNIASGTIATGNIAALAITTALLAANAVTTAKITDLNVTTAKINDLGVTTGKIDDLGVTTAKINAGAVTSAKLDTNIAVTGTLKAASTHAVVLNNQTSTVSLSIVRGHVRGTTGAIVSGNGFTSVRNGTGDFTLTFSTAFAHIPSVCVTAYNNSVATATHARIYSASSTTARVVIEITSTLALWDDDFFFIACADMA